MTRAVLARNVSRQLRNAGIEFGRWSAKSREGMRVEQAGDETVVKISYDSPRSGFEDFVADVVEALDGMGYYVRKKIVEYPSGDWGTGCYAYMAVTRPMKKADDGNGDQRKGDAK